MPNYISTLCEESPEEILRSLALKNDFDMNSIEFAEFLDKKDPLRTCRQRFCYPKKCTLPHVDETLIEDPSEECIYLCGNSLGLKPKSTDHFVQKQLKKWEQMGVEQHFVDPLPAAYCDEYGRERMGRLVGADPLSLVLMNGLTVNLHLLLISFYQPTKERSKILIEKNAFPSDRYAIRSHVMVRGFDPKESVVEFEPRNNEVLIRDDDVIEFLEREGKNFAVICLSGVQYYTGQKFDMERITKVAQRQGCIVGWDLAHAVGNVRICLDDWNVDFACWCTYKYLNSGAGCVSGAYMNKKHNGRRYPHLMGWWSNKKETRFLMQDECDVSEGIDGFRLCNPPPILICCVIASLEIFDEVEMEDLLEKQLKLTGYLEYLLKSKFGRQNGVDTVFADIITPSNPSQRGNQLSLVFSFPLKNVHHQLQRRGVVCDIRLPNVMRVAPAPLYNSYCDVFKFVSVLDEVLRACEAENKNTFNEA